MTHPVAYFYKNGGPLKSPYSYYRLLHSLVFKSRIFGFSQRSTEGTSLREIDWQNNLLDQISEVQLFAFTNQWMSLTSYIYSFLNVHINWSMCTMKMEKVIHFSKTTITILLIFSLLLCFEAKVTKAQSGNLPVEEGKVHFYVLNPFSSWIYS